MEEAIKENRLLYKRWQRQKDKRSKQLYWIKKKEVKRMVAAAKEAEIKRAKNMLLLQKEELRRILKMA